MATENRGVMVYLNPEIERELERYCIDNDITRRNKEGIILPALGTGIVQYLKSTLLSTAPRTVASLSLGAIPHPVSSTSLSSAPSNRLSTGITKSEILELIAESNTSRIPSTVLTREEVVAIVREEIDSLSLRDTPRTERLRQRALGLGSSETEVTNEMMLAAVSTSLPLACVPSHQKVESVTDPTNWEEPIAELASTGMSSREIADKLNLRGFTNIKGGKVSRQSIENYLTRHPEIKADYEKARKEGD